MPELDKKALSERDICTKFITPRRQTSRMGRDVTDSRRSVLHKGRIIVRGKLVTAGKR